MCYRRDLFAQAGLPTDRDQVAALWPDWQSYIATGKQFKAERARRRGLVRLRFQHLQRHIGQAPSATPPPATRWWWRQSGRQKAFNLSVEAVRAGESAKLSDVQPAVERRVPAGSFATVACPAWMTDTIKQNAPQTSGKWDIAKIPGGSGNWGGSFLTVPKQSKHQKEAAELARFLTHPEQASWIFRTRATCPARPRSTTTRPCSEHQRVLQRRAHRPDLHRRRPRICTAVPGSRGRRHRTADRPRDHRVDNGNSDPSRRGNRCSKTCKRHRSVGRRR